MRGQLAFAASIFLFSSSVFAVGIYWSAWDGTVNRSEMDGSGRQTLVGGLQNPDGIALDIVGGKMYWTDVAAQKLQRANLDGGDVADLISADLYQPRGITLDLSQQKMYWINGGNDAGQPIKIECANLDGTGRQTLISRSYESGALFDIALDIAHSKMYFTDYIANKIQSANLDGTGVADVVAGLDDPWGIALDVANDRMYWADAGTLRRAKMDGSAGVALFSRGSEGLGGVALDLTAGKVYWVNGTDSLIQRANLDGSALENVITGAFAPKFIALDTVPEPSLIMSVAIAGAAIVVRRKRR